MIKVGKSIEETISAINEELNDKVDKSTTFAGFDLSKDVSAEAILKSIFKIQSVEQGIQNGGTFVTKGEYDFSEWL